MKYNHKREKMQQQNMMAEDEIDLRELFKTIAKNKKFIFLFTAVVTILAIVYVFIKTPVYEVKSIVRIGYINSVLLETPNILETKLKLIFGVESKTKKFDFENGEITDISSVKKVENFIEITTQAYSNEKAEAKNKEVVAFIQNEYKYKIDEYNFATNSNIRKIQEQIKSVENIKQVQIQEQIKSVENIKQVQIQEQINFLTNVDLVSIENKIKFNEEKLAQYQENVNKVLRAKTSNDTQNMLSAMEILNYQNLILSTQNQIENLNRDKQNIIIEKIPNLKRILDYDIKNELRNLNDSLDYGIKNELRSLNDNLEIEKLKLTNNTAKNSEIVGEIQVNDNPVKPKKSLVIVVALVTGFILSIFVVFFREFIRNSTKE